MTGIKLIVGLGNPGDQYEYTRHNAGFWFLDEVASQYGVEFRPESKFFGYVARIQTPLIDCWLLKPTTYMNRSGQAIQALARFYKIPVSAILVAHDELDLPAGVAKLKQAGGHGGHNGLRDTINTMGKDFLRLRLGIDHPGHKDQVIDYVLKKPSKMARSQIDEACYQASKVVPDLIKGDTAAAMQSLHTKA